MSYNPERQLVRTLSLVAAGLAVALGVFFFLPWLKAGNGGNSFSFYDITFDSSYGSNEYQSSAFYWLAIGVALLASMPGATIREDLARARIRAVAFGLIAGIVLQLLMFDWILDKNDQLSIEAGVWLAMVAAMAGGVTSLWASVAADPDDEDAAISSGTTLLVGLTWGGMLAYQALDVLDTLEQISNGQVVEQLKGDFRMISFVSAGAAIGIGLLPIIARAMRGASGVAAPSAWNYGPAPVSAAYAPAAYAGPAPQEMAPTIEPRHTAATRYNGVVVWEDWRNLVNPIERLAANVRLDIVGEVEGYFEVQAGGRRGFVAKGAVR